MTLDLMRFREPLDPMADIRSRRLPLSANYFPVSKAPLRKRASWLRIMSSMLAGSIGYSAIPIPQEYQVIRSTNRLIG